MPGKYLIIKIINTTLCILLLITFYSVTLQSQNSISKGLVHSNRNENLYEIDKIQFKGNSFFTDPELLSILLSKVSKRNKVHEIVEFYYLSFNRIKGINRFLPPGGMITLKQTLKNWSQEIHFFEDQRAQSDIETIKEFYNQNGFHDAEVVYKFFPDSGDNKNVLAFYINEGEKYTIKSIVYEGLDSVDPGVQRKLKGSIKLKIGEPFNENNVVLQVNTIQNTLQNNGYYYSIFNTPVVSKDTLKKIDSITIKFFTGKRQRISRLTYVDSLLGQKIVTNDMKSRQLAFLEGEWYSKQKIEESRQNLQSLGTFELVSIDTNSSAGFKTDSTLPFRVLTRYRKQLEWGTSLYINRTIPEGFHNGGLEFSYLDRNIGGIAQSLNSFTRFELQNLLDKPEFEWQLGVNYAQPFLWKIGNSRVGGAAQFVYSISKIFTYSQLNTASLQIKFPTKLPAWTYFNGMSFDFLIEWQKPSNLTDAINKALDTIKNESDRNRIMEYFRIYKTLDTYYNNNSAINPTAFIFGFSVFGDSRDDMFNPSKGYFTNFSIDAWTGLGIAKYIRPQFSYNYFTSLNKSTVFALKARTGYIYWWDQDHSYVPAERQFFAGGANSNRGWDSRRLRFSTPGITIDTLGGSNDFINDFIGSRIIIEGTFELRWRFGRPRWASDAVADIINMGIMTGFIDWGNTFHWMAFKDDEYYKDFKLIDYITGLAVSAGLGFGIQTPVGPFRVDFAFPLYDPTAGKNLSKFVPIRNNFWQYKQFHLGIGYSF